MTKPTTADTHPAANPDTVVCSQGRKAIVWVRSPFLFAAVTAPSAVANEDARSKLTVLAEARGRVLKHMHHRFESLDAGKGGLAVVDGMILARSGNHPPRPM